MRSLLSSLLLLASLLCASAFNTAQASRIVAVADIHGGFEPFVSILKTAGLIDAERRWVGGRTIFVQTGDITDRGPGVLEALDLLMALEKQAASAGGRVHVLLGNHEVMNMLADTRDVSAEALKSFGGEAEYRAAFSRDGKYGKWLRTKPILLNLDDTVFMHAGINLDFSKESLDDLNRRARREIAQWDAGLESLEERGLVKPSAGLQDIVRAAFAEVDRVNALLTEKKEVTPEVRKGAELLLPVANIGTSSLLIGEGPLWFRGFATWTDEEGGNRMAAVLKHHRVKRFVTGHSVQTGGRITERFGGSLFLIDTGMLNGRFFPAGRPSALEITAESAKPIYP